MKHISVLLCMRFCCWYWLMRLSIVSGISGSGRDLPQSGSSGWAESAPIRFFFAPEEMTVGRGSCASFSKCKKNRRSPTQRS
jgi:hypothetical protein